MRRDYVCGKLYVKSENLFTINIQNIYIESFKNFESFEIRHKTEYIIGCVFYSLSHF